MRKLTRLFLIFLAVLPACSSRQAMVQIVTPLMESQYAAIHEETDTELAKSAIPGNLKLLEGLLKDDPENLILLQNLAEGFCGYAFSFVEDDDPERASALYLRGRRYAQRALGAMGAVQNLSGLKPEAFQEALKKMEPRHLPHIFWLGNCWSGWLMLNLHDPAALADISKQEWLMRRVLEMDETYNYAGPHSFFGTFYGSRSRIFGGDPEKAKFHFEKSLELTENKYLLTHYLYAKTYAVQMQDRELFERLLKTVLETPLDVLPERRLANKVAKIKAQKLLDVADDLF